MGSHRGVSQMHCMIYKKQDDLPEDLHLPVEQRRKKEVIMVADGRYVWGSVRVIRALRDCVSVTSEYQPLHSHNGTYVNLLKVGHGMASQVVDGDVLGLVVPCSRDPDNLQGNFFCRDCLLIINVCVQCMCHILSTTVSFHCR